MNKRKSLAFILVLAAVAALLLYPTLTAAAVKGAAAITFSQSLAITTDGVLWQWPPSAGGAKSPPVKILENAAAVAEGANHSLALQSDGSLWAWGNNDSGQIGDGTVIYRENPLNIMDNVVSVSAGEQHSLAVTNDGSLWAWGNYGGTPDASATFSAGATANVLKPTKIMEGAATVYAGKTSSFVLKENGSLWAWGFGIPTQQNGENGPSPTQIMADVVAVACGYGFGGIHVLAVKNDGSLLAWGVNNNGQLGDKTTENRDTPVKVLDNVISVAAGEGRSLAITSDGSLWAWGRWIGNSPQKIMDDVAAANMDMDGAVLLILTTDNILWQWDFFNEKTTKIMENVLLPSASTLATATNLTADGYIYDTIDPGADITLPVDLLSAISGQDSAILAIKSAVSGLTAEQKASAAGIDLLTLFAEEAIAQASAKQVSGNSITIDQNSLQELQAIALSAQTAAEQALVQEGVSLRRAINAAVIFKTEATGNLSISIDPAAAAIVAGQLRVQTPAYEISLSPQTVSAATVDNPLTITVAEKTSHSIAWLPAKKDESINIIASNSSLPLLVLAKTNPEYPVRAVSSSNFIAGAHAAAYSVTFNTVLSENIKLSLPPDSGDPLYQAIINSSGNAVGGKFNPVTQMLEAKIKDSDTYSVTENKKDFSDIEQKSQEMQNAINILASKGIINGASPSAFAPDDTITRAEIAALIVRTLSKLEANADGGFSDVGRNDWFFGAVGSAKKYGIINGVSVTTFAPGANIQKDQIVAICARTLRIEMKYTNPADEESLLATYSDRASIPTWGTTDIALATRENLVMKRTDAKFDPLTTMTRGEAAVILYRMFMKIW